MNNMNNDDNSTNPDLLHALRVSCGNLAICLDEEDEEIETGYNDSFSDWKE
jgi:hypothetical protein